MKTLKSAIAKVLIQIFACALSRAEEPILTRDLKILFTGDVHCAIDQGCPGRDQQNRSGKDWRGLVSNYGCD